MTLNFKDGKNEINNMINNNSIVQLLFGNIFILSFIIVLIIFIIVIQNIKINKDKNDKINYTYNVLSIFIYSIVITIISLSIHNKIIKEEYKQKNSTKSDQEFAEMMTGSAEKLVNLNSKKIDEDIERFFSKE